MKKLFEKHETLFCILLIVLYIVSNSLCLANFGETDFRSAVVNTVFSICLLGLVIILKRREYYGLKKPANAGRLLFFLPLALIVSVNLWTGININNTGSEILFYIINMMNVGFIEELIFRGFLYKMMAKDNEKAAVIVSSLTFGVGHIINLFNGAELVPTLLQICYAAAIGWLFVVLFRESGSLIPQIIAHSVNNSLSVFSTENAVSLYIAPVFLFVVPVVYALYSGRKAKKASES